MADKQQRKAMRDALKRWGNFARFCARRQSEIEELEAMMEAAAGLRAHMMAVVPAGGAAVDHTAVAAQRVLELQAVYEERIAAMAEEVTREKVFAMGMEERLFGLERRQREVLELRYQRGMTMRAIANKQQYSEKWIETVERRAVDKLCDEIRGVELGKKREKEGVDVV